MVRAGCFSNKLGIRLSSIFRVKGSCRASLECRGVVVVHISLMVLDRHPARLELVTSEPKRPISTLGGTSHHVTYRKAEEIGVERRRHEMSLDQRDPSANRLHSEWKVEFAGVTRTLVPDVREFGVDGDGIGGIDDALTL